MKKLMIALAMMLAGCANNYCEVNTCIIQNKIIRHSTGGAVSLDYCTWVCLGGGHVDVDRKVFHYSKIGDTAHVDESCDYSR